MQLPQEVSGKYKMQKIQQSSSAPKALQVQDVEQQTPFFAIGNHRPSLSSATNRIKGISQLKGKKLAHTELKLIQQKAKIRIHRISKRNECHKNPRTSKILLYDIKINDFIIWKDKLNIQFIKTAYKCMIITIKICCEFVKKLMSQ